MAAATEKFFDELGEQETNLLPAYVTGTVRFDLYDGRSVQHWRIAFKRGVIFVSREARSDDDCVVTLNLDLFDRIVTGEVNTPAAVLRNEITFTGAVVYFTYFQRLVPAPPGAHDPRPLARAGRTAR